MAKHDDDYAREPLRRGSNRRASATSTMEFDKGTLWAGAVFSAALTVFAAYVMLAGPTM